MKVAIHTEEALAYSMMVTSLLETGRIVFPLATTSTYSVMVSSDWGITTRKMKRYGAEVLSTIEMAVKRSMTID